MDRALPLISIVLPVYNGEKFLSECLDSVIAQNYTNWELILVDDCSTDETPSIIAEYEEKDVRIRSVRHPKNLHLPEALNTGFALAKGEFYTWTSDDNVYLPNAIKCLADCLCEDPSIDVVYGNEFIIDEKGNDVKKRDAIASICEPECIPILSCVGAYFLFRKAVYDKVGGYDTNWFLVEDWKFWLDAYNQGFQFMKVDDCLYLYRDSSESLTAKCFSEIQFRCLMLSLDNLKNYRQCYSDRIVMRAYLKCVGFAYRIPNLAYGIRCLEEAKQVDSEALNYLKTEIKEWVLSAPLVSIVLPVYNGKRYLRESLDSVLSQTYTNWELIIVDDCSTDDTPAIIDEYIKKDARIRMVRHSENLYLPQALNTGFALANGEFYTWTSDDNLYLPNGIERLVDCLNGNAQVDVVYGNERYIDDDGVEIQGDFIGNPEELPIISAIGGYFMFRRKVFVDGGGYDKNWFLVEDWAFWLSAYNRGALFFRIYEANYLYRRSAISLTMTRHKEIQRVRLGLSSQNLYQNAWRYSSQVAMRAWLKNIRACFILGDKEKAVECLDNAKNYNANAEAFLNAELLNWIKER